MAGLAFGAATTLASFAALPFTALAVAAFGSFSGATAVAGWSVWHWLPQGKILPPQPTKTRAYLLIQVSPLSFLSIV